jgi:hypothetical protein
VGDEDGGPANGVVGPPAWNVPIEFDALLPPPTWTVPIESVAVFPLPLPIDVSPSTLPPDGPPPEPSGSAVIAEDCAVPVEPVAVLPPPT